MKEKLTKELIILGIISIIFVPPIIVTFVFAGLPLQKICHNNFYWLPLPHCEINLGEELERQGFSPVITGNLEDCANVKKGWCIEEYGEEVVIDGVKYQMVSTTPKGFKMNLY